MLHRDHCLPHVPWVFKSGTAKESKRSSAVWVLQQSTILSSEKKIGSCPKSEEKSLFWKVGGATNQQMLGYVNPSPAGTWLDCQLCCRSLAPRSHQWHHRCWWSRRCRRCWWSRRLVLHFSGPWNQLKALKTLEVFLRNVVEILVAVAFPQWCLVKGTNMELTG